MIAATVVVTRNVQRGQRGPDSVSIAAGSPVNVVTRWPPSKILDSNESDPYESNIGWGRAEATKRESAAGPAAAPVASARGGIPQQRSLRARSDRPAFRSDAAATPRRRLDPAGPHPPDRQRQGRHGSHRRGP